MINKILIYGYTKFRLITHKIMVWKWNLTSGTAWPQNFPRLRPRFEVSTSKSCPSLFDFPECIARFPDWSPKWELSANFVTSYLKKQEKKTVQKISFNPAIPFRDIFGHPQITFLSNMVTISFSHIGWSFFQILWWW